MLFSIIFSVVCLQLLHFVICSIPTPFDATIQPQFGYICALNDVNGDRNTDILVVRDSTFNASVKEAPKIYLEWLLQDEKGSFNPSGRPVVLGSPSDWKIPPRCLTGDFFGNSALDVLVLQSEDDSSTRIHTMFTSTFSSDGAYSTDAYSFCSFETTKFIDEPNFFDINGDGASDLLGVTTNNSLFCLLGHKKKQIKTCEEFKSECSDLFSDFNLVSKLNYSIVKGMPWLFVDLNADLAAELIIPFRNDKKNFNLEVFMRIDGVWKWQKDFIPNFPDNIPGIGAPLVGDFNGDSITEIMIPLCKRSDCETIASFLFTQYENGIMSEWQTMSVVMNDTPIVKDPLSRVFFRVGDFNLDGYPDLIGTFNNKTRAFPQVLFNDQCEDCVKTRKFVIKKTFALTEPPNGDPIKDTTLSSFFDIKEDGNLDVIIEYVFNGSRKLTFSVSSEKGDTTFLKVQALTNVCDGRGCRPNFPDDIGSAVAWSGACVQIIATDAWSQGTKKSVSCQMPSSTHRSLNLPYTLFGLGRTSSFVDQIDIGAPTNLTRLQTGTFYQLVPNSRIIVVPPKFGTDSSWQHRLFVTPSQLIIQSILVLAIVCVLLLVVITKIHYYEKRKDRREYLAQVNRFPFDAM